MKKAVLLILSILCNLAPQHRDELDAARADVEGEKPAAKPAKKGK